MLSHVFKGALPLLLASPALLALPAGAAPPYPHDHAKGCLSLPLRGVQILSKRSMALISQDGDVAIVRLSWECLDTRAPQLAIQPSSASSYICKKHDIEDVVNGALITLYKDCTVTGYMYAGRLDANGMLRDENGNLVKADPQAQGQTQPLPEH